jgi:hypothetical protein
MTYSFLADIAIRRPILLRAIIDFNRNLVPSASLHSDILSPENFSKLYQSTPFQRAFDRIHTFSSSEFWDFSEESRRLALLNSELISRLGLFFSAAIHAEDISQIILRQQVLELRHALGADIYDYALGRGRYQVGTLRELLLSVEEKAPLLHRIRIMANIPYAMLTLWPEDLQTLVASRLSDSTLPMEISSRYRLNPVQMRTLWFTLKKLLLREVAPEWAPCFD